MRAAGNPAPHRERSGTSDPRELLLSLLPGAGAGTCRTWKSLPLIPGSVARAAADGVQYLAGDAGRLALRLACVERASDIRSADYRGWSASRKSRLSHGEDRPGARRFEKTHSSLSSSAGRD